MLATEIPRSFVLSLLWPQNMQIEESQSIENPTREGVHALARDENVSLPSGEWKLQDEPALYSALRERPVYTHW